MARKKFGEKRSEGDLIFVNAGIDGFRFEIEGTYSDETDSRCAYLVECNEYGYTAEVEYFDSKTNGVYPVSLTVWSDLCYEVEELIYEVRETAFG